MPNTHTEASLSTVYAHAERITANTRQSTRDAGITALLRDAQGGLCWDCGTPDVSEFHHFVGRESRAVSTDDGMLIPGAMGCRACNNRHRVVCATLGTPGRLPMGYVLSDRRAMVPVATLSRAEAVRRGREAQDAERVLTEAARAEALLYA